MAKVLRRERYLQRLPQGVRLWCGVAAVALLVALPILWATFAFSLDPPLARYLLQVGLIAPCLASLAAAFRSLRGRRAVELSDAGVTEVMWRESPVVHLWDGIDHVERAEHGGAVVTETSRVAVDAELERWQELLRRVEAIRSPRAGVDEDVDAGVVATWLGIGAGEAVRVGSQPQGEWLLAFCSMPLLVFLLATLVAVSLGPSDAVLNVAVVFVAGAVAALCATTAIGLLLYMRPMLVVTVGGIRARIDGRTRSLEWRELQGIERRDMMWYVDTRGRPFVFDPQWPNADRLADAIHQVITARRQGRLKGDLDDVPAGAISAAHQTDGSCDRGLSRTDG